MTIEELALQVTQLEAKRIALRDMVAWMMGQLIVLAAKDEEPETFLRRFSEAMDKRIAQLPASPPENLVFAEAMSREKDWIVGVIRGSLPD